MLGRKPPWVDESGSGIRQNSEARPAEFWRIPLPTEGLLPSRWEMILTWK